MESSTQLIDELAAILRPHWAEMSASIDGPRLESTETETETDEEESEDEGSADEESTDEDTKSEKSDKDDFPWDEHNRLKREAAERSKADKKAERERQKEDGKLQELADAETKRANEAESELAKLQRERNAEQWAGAEGLTHPEDVARFLTDEEMEEERAARAALRKLKERRPELFGEQRRSGGDINEEEDGETETRATGGEEPYGLDRLRGVKRKN